ncbi:hypothetical protein [Mycobacterium avium]|uniref:hypothetical protein n=1 Tax=Mycobacterium avium TaxID=1764 RepID=UPI001F439727|nr:hypothetical protein [Mycobacterium avium]
MFIENAWLACSVGGAVGVGALGFGALLGWLSDKLCGPERIPPMPEPYEPEEV